jgi:Arc/MetJ-type ribon-helix-helix transcriptional regulator
MTIHLPENLQNPILAAVHSGRYASLDDAMAEAASLLIQRLKQEQANPSPPSQAEAIPNHKPIWEVVDELRRNVPPEELAKLPKDGAEQLDHYLYGAPKRPRP